MKSRQKIDRAFILDRMKHLLPIADIGPGNLGTLLDNAQITHYPEGLHFLIPADQDREYVYLLDGNYATGIGYHSRSGHRICAE